MPKYKWKGLDGGKQSGGEIEAHSKEEASSKLGAKGIIITNIMQMTGNKAAPPPAPKENKKRNLRGIKKKDLMIFTKKFATMVRAGLPIMKTLRMLENQTEKPAFKYIVGRVYKEVEAGSTLSEAFSQHPEVFDTVYINLLKAGETSGKLTLFLDKLVIQIEKSEKIRSKVKSSLRYPIILLVVATAVVAIMMVKVVPVFATMFAAMGNKLPAPTQLIVDISNFLRNPAGGGTISVLAAITFFGSKYLIKNNLAVKRKFDALSLKLPILGQIIQKATLSKIAMVEGNLAAAGVSVLESLDIISDTMTNELYKEAFVIIKRGISQGVPLSTLYAQCEVFPVTFSQMLAVGEETGNMDEMFEATARFYEEEFDMIVDQLTEMLEPFMIVFMGLTVGFIIVAMYMPIFQIGDIVGK